MIIIIIIVNIWLSKLWQQMYMMFLLNINFLFEMQLHNIRNKKLLAFS